MRGTLALKLGRHWAQIRDKYSFPKWVLASTKLKKLDSFLCDRQVKWHFVNFLRTSEIFLRTVRNILEDMQNMLGNKRNIFEDNEKLF